ncbi:MAG: Crp/Fnr family transcriptional regulator [Collimonas sp.]|uniref:Crp/Fnr family transcriptional regulator n=1 Tax=Collimonas sp. TaxID=1963772 RepID=UPI0032671E21
MAPVENYLMARLPRKDRLCLLAISEPINLHSAEVLCEPGQSIHYVYFPLNSTISLQVLVQGSSGVEVGMVGREGMLGSQVALGVTTAPIHAHVQAAGPAYRIKTSTFCKELTRSVALQRSMNHYLYVRMVQMTTSAGCLRFHPVGQRLARWLLMSQDRAGSDSFHMTHELLAYMLGIRREGVTAAAGILQRLGLIEYNRGYLTVLDRKGLEVAACGCYAIDQRNYADLM